MIICDRSLLLAVFECNDEDYDGRLTREQYVNAVRCCGAVLSKQQLESELEAVDPEKESEHISLSTSDETE